MGSFSATIPQSEITKALHDIKAYETAALSGVVREINKTAVKVTSSAKRNFAGNVPGDVLAASGDLRPHVRHGRLRASIEAEYATASSPTAYVNAGDTANANYASFVEFGTSRARPHPFMMPAADANRDDHVRRMKIALKP